MSNVIVRMDDEDKWKLEALAKARKTTLSAVLRDLVRKAYAADARRKST